MSTTTITSIVTPYGPTTTALEVVDGLDLTDRRVIVTGAASGIGIETARALVAAGASVTLAVRDVPAGDRVADQLRVTTDRGKVDVRRLELTDPASVAAFVADWWGPLHVLVNNAGVMACPLARTPEGWESQLATNHFGHAALTFGLREALVAADGARVVNVSSSGHLLSPMHFDDLHFEHRPYDPFLAYGQSKTANVLFSVGITDRWRDDGIVSNALMPGAIHTNLARHVDQEAIAALRAKAGRADVVWKTAEEGAATSVFCAASPWLDGIGGRYFEDVNEATPAPAGTLRSGVAAHALDHDEADRLWDVTVSSLAARARA